MSVTPTIVGQSAYGAWIFGDGSDGPADVTLGAGITTLTRDMFYNNLIFQTGAILNPAGFKVCVKGTCDFGSNGVIRRNGPDASVGTGGTALANGSLIGSYPGANGGTAAGSAATSSTQNGGGSGGAGGAGSGGAGGAGGTASFAAANGSLHDPLVLLSGHSLGNQTLKGIEGGMGGGGGGGDGTTGGGGGAGGGVIVFRARVIAGTATIEAKGGAGGVPAAGNRGGGGGGGGGHVEVIYERLTGTLSVDVSGGAAGAKTGTGVAGTAGSAGNAIVYINKA
jgi:hypothetical protein